jgi:hypothetical protein
MAMDERQRRQLLWSLVDGADFKSSSRYLSFIVTGITVAGIGHILLRDFELNAL